MTETTRELLSEEVYWSILQKLCTLINFILYPINYVYLLLLVIIVEKRYLLFFFKFCSTIIENDSLSWTHTIQQKVTFSTVRYCWFGDILNLNINREENDVDLIENFCTTLLTFLEVLGGHFSEKFWLL